MVEIKGTHREVDALIELLECVSKSEVTLCDSVNCNLCPLHSCSSLDYCKVDVIYTDKEG